MKLWQKDTETLKEVDKFTVGKDRELDLFLAPFDVMGSLAHIQMLNRVGLLTDIEFEQLRSGLKDIFHDISSGNFKLDDEVEDIHSQVEFLLTQKLGDAGKKIHSARSRNDQVILDIKMYLRKEIREIAASSEALFHLLQEQSERFKDDLLPGYTHLQLAMPSSFGLWFGAYAESLSDDMLSMHAAWEMVNKNPLGSAAGFGSSFPIDREMTTRLLGFSGMHYNVVYAQMSRGKTEKMLAQAMANIAATLSRLSMDACLYLNQNFAFISFPAELTTGSSIMPHKKNPDVFELIRAHCNRIQNLPAEITLLTTNLPSGYHRDMQLLKQSLFPAIKDLKDCLSMATLMIRHIEVKKAILTDEKYRYLFTVEEMNQLVLKGMPLRDAYREIGRQVEEGSFDSEMMVNHTHAGSIGNLQNEAVKKQMEGVMKRFEFNEVNEALQNLLK